MALRSVLKKVEPTVKIRVKVSGFVVIRKEKKTVAVAPIIRTRNQPNLQNLAAMFYSMVTGAPYKGTTASSPGVYIYSGSTQVSQASFMTTDYTVDIPGLSQPLGSSYPCLNIASGNGSVEVVYEAVDTSNASYTATSLTLVVTAGQGTAATETIPIATANVSFTKASDEVVSIQWFITVDISFSSAYNYTYYNPYYFVSLLGANAGNNVNFGCVPNFNILVGNAWFTSNCWLYYGNTSSTNIIPYLNPCPSQTDPWGGNAYNKSYTSGGSPIQNEATFLGSTYFQLYLYEEGAQSFGWATFIGVYNPPQPFLIVQVEFTT